MRPLLLEAGRLLTPKEAERRVLILENPGLPAGQSRITGSLYAGLQLILPGEVAHCHRHTQSAIRFVLEGDRRLHRRERRADDDAPGRFHPHAVVDVSRPRQPGDDADGLARRARHPDREPVRHQLLRALSRRRAAERDPGRRFVVALRAPTCCRSTSRRRGRRRPSSTIPTRAAARRSTTLAAQRAGRIRATASRCAS